MAVPGYPAAGDSATFAGLKAVCCGLLQHHVTRGRSGEGGKQIRHGLALKSASQRRGTPVSLPRAATTCAAATAAAEPPEEPPGTRSVSHGFLVTCAEVNAF